MPKISADTQSTIALFLVSAFVAVVVLLVFHPLSAEQGQLINTFVGMLGTMATGVATFYFGSSKGSAAKDDTINAIATKNVVDGNGASDTPAHPYMTPPPK